MDSQDEVLRIARLLEAVFRVAKISVRDFERRIGMGSGTLTRIFNGDIDLKFRHVFAVLDGLAVRHDDFFRQVYQDRPNRGEVLAQDMMGLLRDRPPALMNPPKGERIAEAVLSDEELERRIVKALQDHGLLDEEELEKKPRRRPRPRKPPSGAPPSAKTPPD